MSVPPSPLAAFRRRIAENPVFCALDTADLAAACGLARALSGAVGGLKAGLEFFAAQGPSGVRALVDEGLPLFLDLKLHDIPNTVAGALRALAPMGAQLINVHAAGGSAMMQAAADALRAVGPTRPLCLGVTVLTSLDRQDLSATGIAFAPLEQVLRLARLAQLAGLDGVVCSPQEAGAVRRICGPDFLIVVPGIRPPGTAAQDQKRAASPADALAAGADVLVIGRPITAQSDPPAAARAILTTLREPR